MATEARERVESDNDAADNSEWPTKADVQRVESKVEELDSKVEVLGLKFEGMESKVQDMRLEIGKLQAGQKWIAWILGVMCAALFAIFATLVVITLQL
ncbi:MAG: hypothetical protein OXI16_04260 [Chloroflexota bacterium]|nr:hypothetical protein [Chloroflexota bacterium]